MDFQSYLSKRRVLVDTELERLLAPAETYPPPLCEAMRYSVFAGGKRLRPILCMAGCEAAGGGYEKALPVAAAVEMIHTYSLIHDDLPAMDDDDLRRGKPTSHKVYGEAMAILTGDALLTEAFVILAGAFSADGIEPERASAVIGEIGRAAGINGMIAGQVMDVQKEGQDFSREELDFIHRNKTARLIEASVSSGALAAGATGETLEALRDYGKAIGLGFQIVDDILDITGDDRLGKERGRDQELGKATYPALYGLEASRQKAQSLAEQAKQSLSGFGEAAEPLGHIADYINERSS